MLSATFPICLDGFPEPPWESIYGEISVLYNLYELFSHKNVTDHFTEDPNIRKQKIPFIQIWISSLTGIIHLQQDSGAEGRRENTL